MNELGFNTSGILADRSKLLIGKILDPSYNPYLLDVYTAAAMDASGRYLSSWSAVKSYSVNNTRTSWNGSGAPSDYTHVALAATSYAYPFSYASYQGSAAWTWLANHIINTNSAEDPKWAFLPRAGGQTGAAVVAVGYFSVRRQRRWHRKHGGRATFHQSGSRNQLLQFGP